MMLPVRSIRHGHEALQEQGALVSLWRRTGPLPDAMQRLLTDREQERARGYASTSRRDAFVSGRVLVKHVIAKLWRARQCGDRQQPRAPEQPAREWRSIEILPATEENSRPMAFVDGQRQPWSVSITHLDGWTAAGVTTSPGRRIGLDAVEITQGVPLRGQEVWFTGAEQELIAGATRPAVTTGIVWGLKEAAFKTLEEDLPFVPRHWEVRLAGESIQMWYRQAPYAADLALIRISEELLLCVASRKSS